MPIKNMIQALNEALRQSMEKDPNVIILGEDVGLNGGVFRVTEGLQAKFGEKRVFDTPLAESGIVGTSMGMSIAGLKPVAEIQFSGFIYPAMNQIVSHVARMRNRSRGRFNCPLVIRAPHQGGVKALEHHAESMESMFMQVPGVKVVMPSGPYTAKGLMIAAIVDPDPVIFLEPLRLYRSVKEDVPEEMYSIEIGKARVVRAGTDVTLVTYGGTLKPCMEAAEKLMEEKVNVEVIDLLSISPLDSDTVEESVKKTGRLVIVHEAPQSAGVGAEISARISERAQLYLKAPILRVTGFDIIIPLAKHELEDIPNVARVEDAIRNVMEY